jgi:hypothetical protein
MNDKKPNEIMITNKVVQSHEVEDPSSPRREESAIIQSLAKGLSFFRFESVALFFSRILISSIIKK